MPKTTVCFIVNNCEAVAAENPNALTELEKEAALAGAIPARIDFPSKTFCFTIHRLGLTANDIKAILRKHGFVGQISSPY